jgi:hypothetical protein
MAARARRLVWGVLGAAAALSIGAVARSPAARASFHAAYRAFRDPTLVDPPAPAAPPAPVSCERLTEDPRRLDVDLAREFQRPPLPADLDDPDGATLATLTLPDLHVPITRRTMRYVRFFASTEAGRNAFLQRYRRAGLYRESIAFALREAGLPEDLLWLAAIESGFDPRAVSQAGAAGLFQLMPETAQLYGLDMSPWVDERRSLVRATQAAVTHLRDLYERFGRWDLALAGYNAGYDRVVSGIEKVARSRGPERLDDRPIAFSDLAAARALPEETINYVPQITAFAIVAANRSRFNLDAVDLGAPLDLGEIAVPEGTRLRTVARAAGVSIDVLREYNPQLLRDRVPPTGGDYLISVPENRVQRALAAFPAYMDQEVLAQNEAEGDADAPAAPILPGLPAELDTDDPLPRRPVPLGKNRLPALTVPGQERVLLSAQALGVGVLQARLSPSLALPAVGWQRGTTEDPLGLFGHARGDSLAAKEPELEKQLGFLREAPVPAEALRAFTLANGITLRVRRDKGAPTTAITVRVATLDDAEDAAPTFGRPTRRGAEAGSSEAIHTITVDRNDADAGIELAATRLRISLGDTSAAELAEIRFRAGDARRKLLQKTPYGQAWLALGEALFPADHPLAGTVLGTGEDGAALRDMMVAEAMRREHELARASITIVGDVDELRAKKLAEAFLAQVGAPVPAMVGPHPRQDRLTVEDTVPSPRELIGWIGPGEGEVGDASLRVAVELLENPKFGLLTRALTGYAATAHAAIEVWPRASVAAIEIAPAPSHDLVEVERKLDAELERLADAGPETADVAMAKYLLHTKVQKDIAAAAATGLPGALHSAGLAKLRHALRPWAGDRALRALDEVTVGSVKNVIRRVLARDHRVVVTTVPRGK